MSAWCRGTHPTFRARQEVADGLPQGEIFEHHRSTPLARAENMSSGAAVEHSEKDLPLRDDIRLLGRILGDTVREQEGETVFDIVERIRRTSIRFRREEDDAARRDLEDTLNSLSRDRTMKIIRAFSFFSHLANIAEDQHHIRRTRAHA